MKRVIPDIINCSPEDNFTQVRNSILRDPKISLKAKGLLALLLSNKEGWYSYAETIKSFSADGEASIRSALQELEANDYLLRVKYRDKDTKVIRGGFWAYTDNPKEFNLDSTLIFLENNNLEVLPRNTEKPSCGKAQRRKPKTNNTNYLKRLTSRKLVSSYENIKKEEIIKKKEDPLTPQEQFYKDQVVEQIQEILEIPELMELVTPSFIKSMKKYIPTKKELSYFIENFSPEILTYYKEFLIYSIIDENLYNNKEMVIPRIALINSNPVRREHLFYSYENGEDINYMLKQITRKPVIQ